MVSIAGPSWVSAAAIWVVSVVVMLVGVLRARITQSFEKEKTDRGDGETSRTEAGDN